MPHQRPLVTHSDVVSVLRDIPAEKFPNMVRETFEPNALKWIVKSLVVLLEDNDPETVLLAAFHEGWYCHQQIRGEASDLSPLSA